MATPSRTARRSRPSTVASLDERSTDDERRLSFYILAQSFLVVAAVMATLSSVATYRWLPVALTIDLTGLVLTFVFWYAFTENLRRLDTLKEIVSEGNAEIGVRGYREIAAIRAAHHEGRSRRGLPILPMWSPSWWLAHGIPIFLGSMWIGLIVEERSRWSVITRSTASAL